MPDCSEMSQVVHDIAMGIGARPGVKNIDDIAAEMQKEFPQIKRDDVVNAINEVSASNSRKQSELTAKLASLRREAMRTSEPVQRQKLKDRINDLNQQLASAPQPSKQPLPTAQSAELDRLRFERDKLQSRIRQRINSLKPQSVFQKAKNIAIEPMNSIRSIVSSMNFHQVMRQGGFITMGNPIRSVAAIGPMLRAFASEQAAHKIASEIDSRPNAPLYKRAGLYLAPTESHGLASGEEQFMSSLAQKFIPGVKASERGYVTFLNKLRADSFDAMTKSLARNGNPTLDESKAIANFVNAATGRGKLGGFEPAAKVLASAFWSPKYVASRFQMLAGEPMWGGTARTRGLIAKEYAKYAIGAASVMALAHLAGAKISGNPKSSDFGKIQIGKSRLDIFSGLAQVATFLAREATGKSVSSTGRTRDLVHPEKQDRFPQSRLSVAGDFARERLSPVPSGVVDAMKGQDMVGEPATLKNESEKLFTPMAVPDIYRAIKEQGVEKGSALGLAHLFGVGLQTYDPKNKPAKATGH